jgi:hypothetical protein
VKQREIAGKENLETVVTEFDSGKKVDPFDPNKFDISLKSSGLDILLGGTLKFEDTWDYYGPKIFINIIFGITPIEYRLSQVDLGKSRVKDNH